MRLRQTNTVVAIARRHLTPFRAEWDPKDPFERIFVCGRSASRAWLLQDQHPQVGDVVAGVTDPLAVYVQVYFGGLLRDRAAPD